VKLIDDRYRELLALMQLFLFREIPLRTLKTVSPSNFAFFQQSQPSTVLSTVKQKKEQVLVMQPPPLIQPHMALKNTRNASPSTEPIAPPETLPSAPPPIQVVSQKPAPLPLLLTDPSSVPNPIEKPITMIEKTKKLTLEPPSSTPLVEDFRQLWTTFKSLFPHVALSESIPSDAKAQQIKKARLKEPEIPVVLILSFQEEQQQLSFLKTMVQGLSVRLAPTRLVSAPHIQTESEWQQLLTSPHLRLIIASDYGLYMHRYLMSHYQELPQRGKYCLHGIPLLLISDCALYLKEPKLKVLLWRAICTEFNASQCSVN
jgi:hypothetical protein